MNYEVVDLEEKMVAGVSARTSNTDPDCQKVIGGLWQKFMAQGVYESLTHKTSSYPIGLYSDYDETSYDVTIGAAVSENDSEDLTVKVIPAGKYAKFHITGDVVNAVCKAWNDIWAMPLERSFAADFEEYLSQDETTGIAEINIYVSLK
ncbi:MAG: GyrI-like domain-containing protein [Oscillospiraceae bacterium]|nr:GyrI-like domain-containing protein [Oscillospiraceae bacterium]